MLDLNKVFRKSEKINDDLIHNHYDSIDRSVVILEIKLKNQVMVKGELKDRPFIIEKSFKNNYDGNLALQKAVKEFDTVEKVKAHLGL